MSAANGAWQGGIAGVGVGASHKASHSGLGRQPQSWLAGGAGGSGLTQSATLCESGEVRSACESRGDSSVWTRGSWSLGARAACPARCVGFGSVAPPARRGRAGVRRGRRERAATPALRRGAWHAA